MSSSDDERKRKADDRRKRQRNAAKVLDAAAGTWASWEAKARAGHTIRKSSGYRLYWLDRAPTPEQVQAAKDGLADPKTGGFVATCACCEITYAIPSVWESIRDHGVCDWCWRYVSGAQSGVLAQRPPTLEEALQAPAGDIRQAEAEVLREALRRAKAGA